MTRWQKQLGSTPANSDSATTAKSRLRRQAQDSSLIAFNNALFLEREKLPPGLQDLLRNEFNQHCFLSASQVQSRVAELKAVTAEAYYERIIAPLETSERLPVVKLVNELAHAVLKEERMGPLYLAEIELEDGERLLRCGLIAQNRLENNGVWQPQHHAAALDWARHCERLQMPLLTLIDTPGADAGAAANEGNQAHSISALIATMADLSVPTLGIVLGVGYSGGAIPLATTNLLFAVRDALFNTIQPQGLAAIARKQKLNWKACAQAVGVSACELQQSGVIDAVIDYSPADSKRGLHRLHEAILIGLTEIELRALPLVAESPALAAVYMQQSQRVPALDESARWLHVPSLQGFPSVFGFAYRSLRSLVLRNRLHTSLVLEIPSQADTERDAQEAAAALAQSQARRFREWLNRDDKLIYDDDIFRCWERYRDARQQLGMERSYIASLFLGHPQSNYNNAINDLCAEIVFSLYNHWQREARYCLDALREHLGSLDDAPDCQAISNDQLKLRHILEDNRFRPLMLEHCQQLKQFDNVYEKVLSHLTRFFSELSERKTLSAAFMRGLLDDAGLPHGEQRTSFETWLGILSKAPGFRDFLRTAEQWKKQQHPRLSSVAFVVASYFFEKLLPEFFESQLQGKPFNGKFQPVSIGRRKDFWNQLKQATIDLRVQAVLNDIKPASLFTPQRLIEHLFSEFKELDATLTSSDPVKFPGFAVAIQRQRSQQLPSSGLITGVARLRLNSDEHEPGTSKRGPGVGLFVSNHGFQAGAFDMASAERLCRLLAHCARTGVPVIGFVCSGGMQTKEGAAALFSMAVVNDAINQFVMETQLPILIVGYGDCTGGAQASLVTHPLVDSYYLSGTNMPFAGRIVVPDYLPVTSTLSNYLVYRSGSMQGLVQHPFVPDLDARLRAIDPQIAVASLRLQDLLQQWLKHRDIAQAQADASLLADSPDELPPNIGVFRRVLIHARGCTAVKLIREAQAMRLQVILVQSDPDMHSVAAESLSERDELVCLGGYTSEESYLNGDSVLRIAELHNAEALHPGIGFLSENSDFARACLAQGLNFVGPAPASMIAMGDKARAIRTAMQAGVPVVPGSHGILRDAAHAHEVANRIGFPVILKAAHGGGGKGILEVHRAEDLDAAFRRIQTEGKSAFGRDEVYLERLVTRFRHIEVQLLRDSFGSSLILGLRDCSIQRNKQKILEESDSTLLTPELADIAREATLRLGDACDYLGAGTVEYIFDLDQQQLYFMEMNTRLQVEHPVTEKVSGVDIVREQFRVAMGKSIDHLPVRENGYAIEVRINAEHVGLTADGELSVTPCPGEVSVCDFPQHPQVDRIVSVAAGKSIPPYYDNLIGQIIAHGDSREDAVAILRDYLSQVEVQGVQTNIPLLLCILEDEVFLSGDYDTSYLKHLVKRKRELLQQALRSTQVRREQSHSIQVEGSDELKVLAPSSSILYRSPSPSQPEYVKEGDRIDIEQPICMLEAMKMFQTLNLASFNHSGQNLYPDSQLYEITHIKANDGQHVNPGDLLFVVKPVPLSAGKTPGPTNATEAPPDPQ